MKSMKPHPVSPYGVKTCPLSPSCGQVAAELPHTPLCVARWYPLCQPQFQIGTTDKIWPTNGQGTAYLVHQRKRLSTPIQSKALNKTGLSLFKVTMPYKSLSNLFLKLHNQPCYTATRYIAPKAP